MFAQSGNWRPIPIIAKTRSAKDVGKRKQLPTLNSTQNLFDQAQRALKQLYDKQHGKGKGNNLRNHSTQHDRKNLKRQSY
jgi:hypothetical protein